MKSILVAAALIVGAAANAACPGDLVRTRVSKLKPGGSMAGFAEAVRDNAKWYVDHGMKANRIFTAPVYEMSGGEPKPSVTLAMTFHIYGGTTAPKHDAAWDAFVAKYKANSSIESETLVCVPKGTIR